MKNWSYAKHSHAVKKLGGPEKYVSVIRAHERHKTTKAVNKKWMHGVIPTLAVLIPFAMKGGYDLVAEYNQRKAVTDAEALEAERELIKHCQERDGKEVELEEPPCS